MLKNLPEYTMHFFTHGRRGRYLIRVGYLPLRGNSYYSSPQSVWTFRCSLSSSFPRLTAVRMAAVDLTIKVPDAAGMC